MVKKEHYILTCLLVIEGQKIRAIQKLNADYDIEVYLSQPGEARDCSTKTIFIKVMHRIMNEFCLLVSCIGKGLRPMGLPPHSFGK